MDEKTQDQEQTQIQTIDEATAALDSAETTEPTTTTSTTDLPNAPAHTTKRTSKLPTRPRKTRKLSPAIPEPILSSHNEYAENPKAIVTTKSTKSKIVPCRPRPNPPPPIILRSLSFEGEIDIALRHLKNADPLLAPLIDLYHPPTFDSFHPPFLALAKSILYQQLAYKAGTSIYTRFVALCGGESAVLPDTVLALTAEQLRQVGVSARKASYLHDLARKYVNGILSDSSIVAMDDKSLFTMLTMVNGIGSWSVHMFMIFSLHRPDVLPVNDLGVRKGVQLLYGLEDLPRPSKMDELCEKWRPYRSVASWYIWRFVESKGAPSSAAAPSATSLQQQTQQQEQQQQQYLDPINNILNIGACTWGQ